MSQIALRFVDYSGEPPASPCSASTTPNPPDLDDQELLACFLPNSERIIEAAGGFRRALTLSFEDLAPHGVTPAQYSALRTATELGRRYVEAHVHRGEALTSPDVTRRALTAMLRDIEHEVFYVLFLSNRHTILSGEPMFRGTVDAAAVYPREIVKRGLALNAAAVVLAHQHPSGSAEPSRSDIAITKRIIEALALVDIRVLDHFVIGDGESVSFAEHGWI